MNREYGKRYRHGDKITVLMDLQSRTLHFIINDKVAREEEPAEDDAAAGAEQQQQAKQLYAEYIQRRLIKVVQDVLDAMMIERETSPYLKLAWACPSGEAVLKRAKALILCRFERLGLVRL